MRDASANQLERGLRTEARRPAGGGEITMQTWTQTPPPPPMDQVRCQIVAGHRGGQPGLSIAP
jgi:hypothetical protein